MKMQKWALALAVCAMSTGALAVEDKWYVGGAVGVSQIDIDCAGASTCDDSGTGYKLYGGYKLSKELAVEAVYLDFGKFKFSDGLVSLNLKPSGFGAGVSYRSEFSPKWSFIGRVGVASIKTKAEARVGSLSGSDSDDKVKVYGGLGVGYALSSSVIVDATWDFTQWDYADENGRVDLFSVNVNFAF